MKCPNCGAAETSVINSRRQDHGVTYRRRLCSACKQRFSTVEVIKPDMAALLTSRGSVRPLTNKLLAGAIASSIGDVLTQLETAAEAEERAAAPAEARRCAS